MDLERYITEAISGNRKTTRRYYGISDLSENPSKTELIKWLIDNGYEDVDDFSGRFSAKIKTKKKIFCVTDDFLRKGAYGICIMNGDGENEYQLFFSEKSHKISSMSVIKMVNGQREMFNLQCDREGLNNFKNWLSEYINEAVSHGYSGKYIEFEECLDFDKIQQWLLYKGYPDLVVERSTQYLLSKKFVGFYVPKYSDERYKMICIVNGDGEVEYRPLFSRKTGRLDKIYACRVTNGKWSLEDKRLTKESVSDLENWLEKGSGIREAVSHGYPRKIDDRNLIHQIEWNYDIEDIATVLEASGYKKVDFASYASGVNEYRKWFSGKKKEFIVYVGLSTDYIAVSNENRDLFYLISFKKIGGNRTKMSEITEVRFNKGSGGEGAVMISVTTDELIKYLEY
jgi:hypothetical protein